MYKENIKILINYGLHLRPATKIVKLSKTFKSDINIYKDDKLADSKNLFQLQRLGILYGDTISIVANGKDEYEAVNEIIKLIKSINK